MVIGVGRSRFILVEPETLDRTILYLALASYSKHRDLKITLSEIVYTVCNVSFVMLLYIGNTFYSVNRKKKLKADCLNFGNFENLWGKFPNFFSLEISREVYGVHEILFSL
jgi:hypothetical protein